MRASGFGSLVGKVVELKRETVAEEEQNEDDDDGDDEEGEIWNW